MNEITTAVYRMNPATDRIIFGDELEEGMWVLPEDPWYRQPDSETEDEQIRAQRFRRVTRLAITHRYGSVQARFIGEWVDGYQEVHWHGTCIAWLVRKDPAGDEENTPS
jgi:hypothetical protein